MTAEENSHARPMKRTQRKRAERSREGDGPKVVQGLNCKLNPFPSLRLRSPQRTSISCFGKRSQQAGRKIQTSPALGREQLVPRRSAHHVVENGCCAHRHALGNSGAEEVPTDGSGYAYKHLVANSSVSRRQFLAFLSRHRCSHMTGNRHADPEPCHVRWLGASGESYR